MPRILFVIIAAVLIALAATPACTRSNASSDKAPADSLQRPQPLQPQQTAAQSQADFTPEVADLHHKAESGNAQAMAQLANAYEKGEGAPKDLQQAFMWFTKAANAGDSYAMYRLARLYASGSGVPKDDVEAFDWYKRAAAAGNSEAMYDLGRAYETGSGVREDIQRAVHWYEEADLRGNTAAKAALARLGESIEDH